MIPPYELKNKTFQTVFKGYSKAEVDEYFAFLIEKYTELYRAQDSLTRRLAESEAALSLLREKEDAIRSVLVNSQSAAKKLTDDAQKKSEYIIESTRTNCEKIIDEFKQQIKVEIETLAMLRSQVLEFKSRMFAEYQKHIELINNITPTDPSHGDFALSPNEYTARILAQARIDARNGMRSKSRREIEEEKACNKAIKLTVEDILSPDFPKGTNSKNGKDKP